jgi:FMN phosphatase YigB (HAD superfamily)
MIAKSAARPEEIVYIDDNGSYAQPARDLGVKVVIHRQGDTEGSRAALRQHGGMLAGLDLLRKVDLTVTRLASQSSDEQGGVLEAAISSLLFKSHPSVM